jgi:AcrR family transcriptional regulator
MPRSPAANAERRDASRERLLIAALACFARAGYAESTVRDIATEAGVATGLLYAHFPSKAALLEAAFARSMADVRASFASAAAAPPGQQVEALIRAAAATVRAHLPFWQLGYAARQQPAVRQALAPVLADWEREIQQVLATLLAAQGATAPAAEALALFAQIDGVCQHFAQAPDRYPLDAVVERVVARWAPAP